MTRISLLLLFFVGLSFTTQAQQIAKTNSGKAVVLFDNGTWKYVDGKLEAEATSESIKEISVKIELKDATTSKLKFLNGPSAKLKKYFKIKNKVNADMFLASKDGKVRLTIEWRVMTAEAYSYFGYIKKGGSLKLDLLGGKSVELIYTEEFDPLENEKYGLSTYRTHLDLDLEQIALLQSSIVTKATMSWSKRSEDYTIETPAYFVNELPKLMK